MKATIKSIKDLVGSIVSCRAKSKNMLAYEDSKGRLQVIKKFDATRDIVYLFAERGLNRIISLRSVMIKDNSDLLPSIDSAMTDDEITGPENNVWGGSYADILGPYELTPGDAQWHAGSHVSPFAPAYNTTWVEIVGKTSDSITLADASDFPDPIDYQICSIQDYNGGAYSNKGFFNYTKAGNVLTLTIATPDSPPMSPTLLDSVVIGGDNPSQCVFVVPTAVPGTPTYLADRTAIASETWTACSEVSIEVTNSISPYDTIDASTHIGTEILSENVTFIINQNSGNVYIDLETTVKDSVNVSVYYGSQLIEFQTAYAPSKYYYAHSDDPSLIDSLTGTDSGARATYPCEKHIMLRYGEASDNNINMSGWVDLLYGTPSEDRDTDPFWKYITNKVYFQNIGGENNYVADDLIKWRGGLNFFANDSDTEGVIAYWEYKNNATYYIIDFTDSLSFNHDEVFTAIANRSAEVISKDDSITVNDLSGNTFGIPSIGLSLSATGAGNIELKINIP